MGAPATASPGFDPAGSGDDTAGAREERCGAGVAISESAADIQPVAATSRTDAGVTAGAAGEPACGAGRNCAAPIADGSESSRVGAVGVGGAAGTRSPDAGGGTVSSAWIGSKANGAGRDVSAEWPADSGFGGAARSPGAICPRSGIPVVAVSSPVEALSPSGAGSRSVEVEVSWRDGLLPVCSTIGATANSGFAGRGTGTGTKAATLAPGKHSFCFFSGCGFSPASACSRSPNKRGNSNPRTLCGASVTACLAPSADAVVPAVTTHGNMAGTFTPRLLADLRPLGPRVLFQSVSAATRGRKMAGSGAAPNPWRGCGTPLPTSSAAI